MTANIASLTITPIQYYSDDLESNETARDASVNSARWLVRYHDRRLSIISNRRWLSVVIISFWERLRVGAANDLVTRFLTCFLFFLSTGLARASQRPRQYVNPRNIIPSIRVRERWSEVIKALEKLVLSSAGIASRAASPEEKLCSPRRRKYEISKSGFTDRRFHRYHGDDDHFRCLHPSSWILSRSAVFDIRFLCQLKKILSAILREKNSSLEIVGPAQWVGRLLSLGGGARENPEPMDSFFAAAVRATVISKLEILSPLISSKFYNAAHRRQNYESWFIFERASALQMERADIPDEVPTGRKCVRIHRAVPCLLRLIGICIVNA